MSSHDYTPAQIAKLLQRPALEPPPGVVPNFENPPDMNHLGATIVYLIIATLATAMRVYTKLAVLRQFHLEDCMAPPSRIEAHSNDSQTSYFWLGYGKSI
jgi:hypothetical protein